MTKFSQMDFIQKHIALYRRDPEKAHMWDSSPGGGPGVLPTLLLTTTGRKSGEPRTQPLACFPEGEDWIVVASNNGQDKHPAWFLNLQAKPEARMQIGRIDRAVQAHVAEGEERDRLWPWLKERNPAYAGYERKTERRIPVVVLRPLA